MIPSDTILLINDSDLVRTILRFDMGRLRSDYITEFKNKDVVPDFVDWLIAEGFVKRVMPMHWWVGDFNLELNMADL